jgi:hypothetical protein
VVVRVPLVAMRSQGEQEEQVSSTAPGYDARRMASLSRHSCGPPLVVIE